MIHSWATDEGPDSSIPGPQQLPLIPASPTPARTHAQEPKFSGKPSQAPAKVSQLSNGPSLSDDRCFGQLKLNLPARQLMDVLGDGEVPALIRPIIIEIPYW